MASAKEIKNRIKSINDTQKITNAMYLISSMKLRKAKEQLEKAMPFFYALDPAIGDFLKAVPDLNSIYFDDYVPPRRRNEEPEKKKTVRAYLVVTADKGLAGAYNHNIIKQVETMLKEALDVDESVENQLFVVGELGRQYFYSRDITVSHNFLYTAQDPKLSRARAITTYILPRYERGEIDEIYLIYTSMVNSMRQEVKTEKLLPLHKAEFITLNAEGVKQEQYEFQTYPSADEVVTSIMPNYFAGFVYRALVEAFACEQNARMTAMKAANDNASDMLKSLNIQYNRIRQASITQEITEVIGGAKALRKK